MLYHYERAIREFKEHWTLCRTHRKLQRDSLEEEGIREMTGNDGLRLQGDIHLELL